MIQLFESITFNIYEGDVLYGAGMSKTYGITDVVE